MPRSNLILVVHFGSVIRGFEKKKGEYFADYKKLESNYLNFLRYI
jgi:hypothetical protein